MKKRNFLFTMVLSLAVILMNFSLIAAKDTMSLEDEFAMDLLFYPVPEDCYWLVERNEPDKEPYDVITACKYNEIRCLQILDATTVNLLATCDPSAED